MSEDCVFCREVIGRRNASIICENELAIAFMDHAPVEEGHMLVIPKKHFRDIFSVEEESYIAVHRMARELAPLVMKVTEADGMNIGQNNGACANQIVFHYHLHIIPRFCERKVSWDRRKVSTDELEKFAFLLREEIRKTPGTLKLTS
ncbi:MAG: HIT family protein [Candidatus Thermoplasmatota archaeon]|jgi:bis(5'-nucleosidyl)-tetraphosphatase/histidine triad (HIT) family protein|nr:HIT family protein [Candidatus Thermoplasmatota archaeon]MCL5785917.1 HIT family protein [Candidatus Thermoplasmatota archaeon]